MSLQDLTKQELSALIAGEHAIKGIIGRLLPDELPKYEIRQWEVAALLSLENAQNALALDFKRRIEAGATVQAGPYFLTPDARTMDDLQDEQEEGATGGFNCWGFDQVGFKDPAEAEPETEPKPKRRAEAETWALEIVLSSAAVGQTVLAKLAGFKRRSDLKSTTERKVIAAARAALAEAESQPQGTARKLVNRSGKGKRP